MPGMDRFRSAGAVGPQSPIGGGVDLGLVLTARHVNDNVDDGAYEPKGTAVLEDIGVDDGALLTLIIFQQYLATASEDRCIKVWNAATG
eukprot:13770278-Alexandrium_andersonii.AAC.1